MTQEDKELLLKDLSARLPYRVKVIERSVIIQTLYSLENAGKTWYVNPLHDEHGNIFPLSTPIEECKPYLRSMESMTEEEEAELMKLGVCEYAFHNDIYDVGTYVDEAFTALSWLFERHFDVNGLIEKGLAIEVTEEHNPYKED